MVQEVEHIPHLPRVRKGDRYRRKRGVATYVVETFWQDLSYKEVHGFVNYGIRMRRFKGNLAAIIVSDEQLIYEWTQIDFRPA